MVSRAGCAALFLAFIASAADAQTASPTDDVIVVTATRSAQSGFDLPVSISVVTQAALSDQQLGVNLSEALTAVPGLVVLNRQNYAQDEQLSIRGFGARSTFGVRGVRLYEDGVPATMPDGQGQTSHFDLPSTARVEVLRGPFSALYGNSSGGVISLFTEDGGPDTVIDTDAAYGSFGTRHIGSKLSGSLADMRYTVDVHDFSTEGYRQHSAAERENSNAKLSFTVAEGVHLTLVANALDMPNADDALGLTHAQFNTDPKQAGVGALPFNTRKSLNQEQVGAVLDDTIDAHNTLHAVFYGGHRGTEQFQAIPVATEASPASPGGVIGLDRDYFGTDESWVYHGTIGSAKWQTTVGFAVDQLDEARRGYQNFIGSVVGVKGALRRNEENLVSDFDQYIQTELDPTADWVLVAGVRHSEVRISDHDHYVVPGNGNDSGGTAYSAITPVGGVTWKLNPAINLYASYGRGFETPTLNELAYRSTDGTLGGFNFALRPARSDDYETGIKAKLGEQGKLELTGFHIETMDELAVQANSNGRAVYRNVGSTVRNGVELSFSHRWDHGLATLLSYSFLRATYATPFTTCPQTPCVPLTVAAGTKMPGVPENNLYGEFSWREQTSGFSTALELNGKSSVTVNDPGSDAAPAYVAVNLRGGFAQDLGPWALKEFLRIENLLDRHYAGSVIVNESNGRYFEPAAVRAVYAGLNAAYQF